VIEKIERLRNIGISAHIDSGKTTLTERILYYTRRIHAMHEVKGKDGVGALMDSMDLERERGITISSAATSCTWKGIDINIIDTPGHVDFTIEVERALRVLDGAILVLCAVGGVQSQSLTVNRQMERYRVPRLAFVNKCDRTGADPVRVAAQIREKLGQKSVLVHLPIGLETNFEGIIDLVIMKAVYFEGKNGDQIVEKEIPAEHAERAVQGRQTLLEALADHSDEIAHLYLEGRDVPLALAEKVLRDCVISRVLLPVFIGSAYKNKGVQLLLDGIMKYLPSPVDVDTIAYDQNHENAEIALKADCTLPFASIVFKLEDGPFGQLSYLRVYQGALRKGDTVAIGRTGKKVKIGRLVKMHADTMEEIDSAGAGDIAAVFGVDCASGDSITDPSVNIAMTKMHVAEPVVHMAITPADHKANMNMAKALNRFTKEDPTFRSWVDPESNEQIIAGMGELHLDIYVERMKREYDAIVTVGAPQVAYRETITKRVEFSYTHKKQTGGAGQFGKVEGFMEVLEGGDYEFVDKITGGAIPREFIPSVDDGFRKCLPKGDLIGFPIVGVRMTVNDGASHPVDSSDMAFQMAAIGAFRDAYRRAAPVILEPVMKVSVDTPTEFQGTVLQGLSQRRGIIISALDDLGMSRIDAEVPLSEMFGYTTSLRSGTQGKAEFTMEFSRYQRVSESIKEKVVKAIEEQRKKRGESAGGGRK